MAEAPKTDGIAGSERPFLDQVIVETVNMSTLQNPTPDESTYLPTTVFDDTALPSRTAEIIRQVEYYLSDDNLCQDAHLLALFQEDKGTVSVSDICSFRKMRKFKSQSDVAEALRQSTQVEVSRDGTRLRRRFPLEKPITVQPQINSERKKTVVPRDKPWLTKGMMKPTGFEDYATDGPIKPAEYAADREDYDPEICFTLRIETAIMRFCARRTMHQETRNIFEKFMIFGGMDTNSRQFTGGLNGKEMENMTKKEIAELTSYYSVSERVLDGLHSHEDGRAVTWYVDFEKLAKAFFSSHFLYTCDWYDESTIATATNLQRNFYNYLLLHDVCPEFRDNLMAARMICDLAEQELPKLKQLGFRLPGGFSVACSTLFQGHYAGLHVSGGDWATTEDDMGWSQKDAELVFNAGIFADGTDEQIQQYEDAMQNGTPSKIISSEELGLEITAIEPPSPSAQTIYSSPTFTNTQVQPMGRIKCKTWIVPHAAPRDLPKAVKAAQRKIREYEFLVDEETLQFCLPGMKMKCCVKTLDLGIKWIDRVEGVYATFFTWLANERIREWVEPGPPKGWMLRQKRRRDGEMEGEDDGEGADVEDGKVDGGQAEDAYVKENDVEGGHVGEDHVDGGHAEGGHAKNGHVEDVEVQDGHAGGGNAQDDHVGGGDVEGSDDQDEMPARDE